MKKFTELVADSLREVDEIFPWDLEERLESEPELLLLDVREPEEYQSMHIQGSLNVPRGILETACEWGFEETVPELVRARDREVVVVCRSGNRSALAARVMQQMGYDRVTSLKTGLRGWSDYELPLVNGDRESVDQDAADEFFTAKLRPDQLEPRD
jgi:rhodanese-related sulfurtransferase